MCAPYVVGNLKENFKSDTPNDKSCDSQYVDVQNLHICVCTSKREYRIHMFLTVTALQSWAGFQKSTQLNDVHI